MALLGTVTTSSVPSKFNAAPKSPAAFAKEIVDTLVVVEHVPPETVDL